MEIKAKLNNLHIAPRKVRLMANLITGMTMRRAEQELAEKTRRAALPLLGLIRSAAANASHNFQLETSGLYIKKIVVDPGPVLKRMRPRAFGRGAVILKRTSHVALTLETEDDVGRTTMKRKKDQPLVRDIGAGDRSEISQRPRANKGAFAATETAKKTSKGFVERMFRRKAI
ncbi:MAG: 50S ribosomal protein L22 [Parcubacteria group bacterium Gr01-1014_33]|nr:MAG: 50S ribosomal protein L22 [Parcubacteria group bacterium Gr01-1014_33]